jgi:hypothetical protein
LSVYIVIVCGDRDYGDRDKVYEVLDAYYARIGPDFLLINGGARGADTLAREWAVDRKVDHLTLYAKWDQHFKAAGPIRNRRMAKKKPRLVLAFHPDIKKSKGTKDMVGIAEKKGIKHKVFK